MMPNHASGHSYVGAVKQPSFHEGGLADFKSAGLNANGSVIQPYIMRCITVLNFLFTFSALHVSSPAQTLTATRFPAKSSRAKDSASVEGAEDVDKNTNITRSFPNSTCAIHSVATRISELLELLAADEHVSFPFLSGFDSLQMVC
jgi:hypothetical protein